MDNLAKKETISIGPPARCATHDIILSGYITVISNRDVDLSGVRIPQTQDAWEENMQHNWRDDIVRSSGNELWKQVRNKSPSLKPRRGWGGGWWTQWQFIEISKKMDAHNYVNKEITFVRSNDIMMYARGEHPRANTGWKVHPKYGTR